MQKIQSPGVNLIQFLPYFPPHAGGVEMVAEELSYFYAQKGYGEVINVVFDVGQIETKEYYQRGYSVYLLPSFDIIPNFPVPKFWKKEFWEVIKIIGKICHPELVSGSKKGNNHFNDSVTSTEGQKQQWIIQTHTRFFLSSFIGGIFAKKHKIKWVHVEHGSDYVQLGSTLKSKVAYIYDRIIGKWIFNNADEIVAISEGVKDFVVSLSSSDLIRGSNKSTIDKKIDVIYNGIHFIPGKKVENQDVIQLGFVGRLVQLKGVNLLLEAFKKVSETYTNIELTIVGDGEEKEALEKYVQANHLKNVTFLGKQSREYIANEFLPTIDILVNPSYQEGLPTTVIEGLVSGCLVVASDVGGTKEISKEEDLIIIEKGNSESLKKGLEKAIQTYKQVREKSKEGVEKKFNWDNNIEEYFNLYKNIQEKKKKIIFLAPKNEGGTYYYYKDLSDYLIQNYKNEFDVHFCNSLFDYIKLHFLKVDIIFSIIPFIFKPLFAKRYIYNLHGNYKVERKNKGLGVKLLYLSELNLWFSDSIMLTSYYLADKLNFKKKYEKKVILSHLFIDSVTKNKNEVNKNEIHLLTISSSNFLEKGLGVYDLAKEIFKINDVNINWKIVLPGNQENKNFILEKINTLRKNNNINIEILGFLSSEELNNLYENTDIFVYASNLETWGGVIMESCSFGKPIILLENDLWKYIYPKEMITTNFKEKFLDVLESYNFYSELSYDFVLEFQKENVINDFVKTIKKHLN